MSRKQIAFTEATHMKIERAALDVSIKTGKIVKWTDVVHFMVEKYLEEAKKDMVHNAIDKREKKQPK
ncbi:hypothetical protein QE197_21450 (plasmid) [Arsenophonus nasoniae]|uniref:Uncharacterized protein n=1 Tax=Arsenophonus nasoniae TaxID=638 RepID=A0A4P7L1A7_9GAMM|nr:hypothetical protein [Arsenophonus nasoniae]QBY43584.1 hypothetical protein ArsFIN_21520 [Arsenophonus nasoniae]QBY46236.1 hypothetical protein ArsFIN_48470 [Arsenophonus nasoniae]WGM07594.1 hypothetical protein QE258_10330 [Arsenophonus nasoniae]WGM08156.1 hypothetical protein QE258_23055 [Arsenophonus nasoniae]WGM12396.1 hypothetical protein QE197_09055 [Arsenophonus nasoniae]